MPSKDPIQRFNILENIIRIEEFTAGMDVSAFVGDAKTYDAVERCLERISEAASKLGPQAEELCPEIPWSQIRGVGNRLRHEYDKISGPRTWFMVERDLAPLRGWSPAPRACLRPRGTQGTPVFSNISAHAMSRAEDLQIAK